MSNGGGANQTGAGAQPGAGAGGYPFQSMPAQGPGGQLGVSRMGQSPFGQQQINQQQFAPPQNAPFGQQSQGLMGLGRGNDSTLVHMTPGEVGGLQQLAQKFGGSLSQNPHTGLPEAGFLSSILPLVAGAALTATGVGAPVAAGVVAAEEGIRNRDWKKGLMAGIGAYGGAGLGSALTGAGEAAGAGAASAASDAAVNGAATSAVDSSAAGLAASNPGLAANMAGAADVGADAGSAAMGFSAPSAASLGSAGAASPLMANAAQGSSAAFTPAASAGASMPSGMSATPSFSTNMSNMGRGIGSLGDKGVMSSVGSQVGKQGAMEMAAPAMYEAMNPDPIKPLHTSPPKYWTAAQGYNSLYNPTTHGFNPGQFVDTFPGMAAGGAVDPNAAAMAKYQAMITPGPAAAPPPSSSALNNYLAQMAHNNTTYTPPSVAAPTAGALRPMGPMNGPGGGGYFPGMSPPPGMYPPGMTPPPGGQPNVPPSFWQTGQWPTHDGGGRRAGGGLVSLMGGGSVNGPGDGVSDSVPAVIDGHQQARLAKGEFVVPARIVSELGNGSSDAGAQRLYQMMHRVEQARKRVQMAGDSEAYGNLPA